MHTDRMSAEATVKNPKFLSMVIHRVVSGLRVEVDSSNQIGFYTWLALQLPHSSEGLRLRDREPDNRFRR
jgi:hypothetical protein